MNTRRISLLIFTVISMPVVWIIFYFYRNILIGPIINGIIVSYPQYFEDILLPYPLVASILNLILFGTVATVWPHIGFGQLWKPDRKQSLVVFLLICFICIIFITVMHFLPFSQRYIDPFKKMGFVIWTITPVQEEIIFRGFIYSFLLWIFGKTHQASFKDVIPVILIGTIWFSLWHLTPHAIGKYGWGFLVPQLIVTFILGILFNILRYWTGSIWLIIPVHAACNIMFSII